MTSGTRALPLYCLPIVQVLCIQSANKLMAFHHITQIADGTQMSHCFAFGALPWSTGCTIHCTQPTAVCVSQMILLCLTVYKVKIYT